MLTAAAEAEDETHMMRMLDNADCRRRVRSEPEVDQSFANPQRVEEWRTAESRGSIFETSEDDLRTNYMKMIELAKILGLKLR